MRTRNGRERQCCMTNETSSRNSSQQRVCIKTKARLRKYIKQFRCMMNETRSRNGSKQRFRKFRCITNETKSGNGSQQWVTIKTKGTIGSHNERCRLPHFVRYLYIMHLVPICIIIVLNYKIFKIVKNQRRMAWLTAFSGTV